MKFKSTVALLTIGLALLLSACGPEEDDDFGRGRNGGGGGGNVSQADIEGAIAALPEDVLFPSNNTYSAEKENLGRLLFWDPILSGNKDVACATCHHPNFGYADGLAFSQGVNGSGLGPDRTNGVRIKRNSPTVINTAFNGIDINWAYDPAHAPMFWDSRIKSLEKQATEPIFSKEEMRGEGISEEDIIDIVVARLGDVPAYRALFQAAFGTAEVNADRIGKAIATFERGIVANNSRFDRYMRGDENALSNTEIDGMQAFVRVGCANCHAGPMFSDYELHTIGIREHGGISDTGANGDFQFRTPTLRNLNLTGPYMHNGIFKTLNDVVAFYEDVSDGRDNAIHPALSFDDLDREVRQLGIGGGNIDEIVAFLRTLNDAGFDKTVPGSVPSGLPVGGNID